ncbi:hypothetical protein PVK06_042906 [Gossypium arboreum]|uniref:Uncharacterized protein n=1 Tax=Gossypium arboreum TaxID=29729 RepID=A0ABR0MPK0_GOSAR|nr:hypothetical protein PVK06_042906 [Gossypium arboreum]
MVDAVVAEARTCERAMLFAAGRGGRGFCWKVADNRLLALGFTILQTLFKKLWIRIGKNGYTEDKGFCVSLKKETVLKILHGWFQRSFSVGASFENNYVVSGSHFV